MAISSTGLSTKGLRSEFFASLAAVPETWRNLCTVIPSTTSIEQYRWLGNVPRMREWGSGRLAKGLAVESYNVENLKYEITMEVDRDELSDDQTNQITQRVRSLGTAAAQHKEKLMATLLENGSSSGYDSYDGVEFFGATHDRGANTSQDNEIDFDISDLAAVEGPDDITNPTVKQFQQGLHAGVAQMGGFLDETSEPVVFGATGLAVVVPYSMQFNARAAMAGSIESIHGGAVPNASAGIAQVYVNPYLTDLSKIFLFKLDGHVKPFIFQDREPIEFAAIDSATTDSAVFNTEKYLYGVRARYRLTYGEPLYAVSIDFKTD